MKCFHKRCEIVILIPENPEYKAIKTDKDIWDAQCAIIGVVVGEEKTGTDS